jgi:hypothetical protein
LSCLFLRAEGGWAGDFPFWCRLAGFTGFHVLLARREVFSPDAYVFEAFWMCGFIARSLISHAKLHVHDECTPRGRGGAPSKMATPHTLPLWFIVLFFLLRGLYLRVASKRQRNARSLRRASERLSCRLHDPQRGAFIAGKPCSRCSFEQQRAANAFTDLALEAWKRFRGHSVNCI